MSTFHAASSAAIHWMKATFAYMLRGFSHARRALVHVGAWGLLLGSAVLVAGLYLLTNYLEATLAVKNLTPELQERTVMLLPRVVSPVRVKLVVGDILQPKAIYSEKRYDAVVLSAPINEDSLRMNTRQLTFLSRNVLCTLAQSLDNFTPPDERTLDLMARTIASSLSQQLSIPPSQVPKDILAAAIAPELDFYCVDQLKGSEYDSLYRLFQFDLTNQMYALPKLLPVDGRRYFREQHISYLAVIGLFNSAPTAAGLGQSEKLTFKIKDQLPTAIFLSLRKFDQDAKGAYRLAIPALAGTETRPDSPLFLTYEESYNAILSTLIRYPWSSSNVTEVNVIIYDKLHPKEFERAVAGFQAALFEAFLWESGDALRAMLGGAFLTGLVIALILRTDLIRDKLWMGIWVGIQLLGAAILVTTATPRVQDMLSNADNLVLMSAAILILAQVAVCLGYITTLAVLRQHSKSAFARG